MGPSTSTEQCSAAAAFVSPVMQPDYKAGVWWIIGVMDRTQIASKDKSLLMRATDCVDGTDGTHAKACTKSVALHIPSPVMWSLDLSFHSEF